MAHNDDVLEKLFLFDLPEKSFKNEKEFTSWFWKAVHDKWGMWHKISDMSADMKPWDAIIWLWGVCWILEIKHGREKKRVDVYKKLRPNQKFWLNRYQKNGGTAIVIYYNEFHHRYWVCNYSEDMDLLFVSK